MVEKGLEFFRTSDTANAALMLYLHEIRNASGQKSPPHGPNQMNTDFELAVLSVRAAMEDLDEPGRGDEVNAHLRKHRRENIASLYEKADSGDEWSQKIVAALEESTEDTE